MPPVAIGVAGVGDSAEVYAVSCVKMFGAS